MKLAYSSNAYMRHTISEAIERIASLGYEAMELMADVPHAWPLSMSDADLDTVRNQLDHYGLSLSNVNAFMMNAVQNFWHPSWIEPDPDYRRMRVQHTLDALTMASKLGATCITTEPGGPVDANQSREAAIDLFVEGLREALTHAESVGVQLLVEPEPGLLIENVVEFLALAERVDSPMFGLNFDVGHFYCVGEPLPAAIERLTTWARHYHIEDIAASRVHRHIIPGHGAIDFAETLHAIAATGYNGWLTVELYPYLEDPDAAGREARDHLQQWMPS